MNFKILLSSWWFKQRHYLLEKKLGWKKKISSPSEFMLLDKISVLSWFYRILNCSEKNGTYLEKKLEIASLLAFLQFSQIEEETSIILISHHFHSLNILILHSYGPTLKWWHLACCWEDMKQFFCCDCWLSMTEEEDFAEGVWAKCKVICVFGQPNWRKGWYSTRIWQSRVTSSTWAPGCIFFKYANLNLLFPSNLLNELCDSFPFSFLALWMYIIIISPWVQLNCHLCLWHFLWLFLTTFLGFYILVIKVQFFIVFLVYLSIIRM